jgi:senataxin
MQLPATILSQDLRRLGRDQSTMQRLIETGHPYDILDTQYRMHPSISMFPNQRFYYGILKDAESVRRRPFLSSSQDWLQNYAFLDLQGEETHRHKKISNMKEAVFVAKLVNFLKTSFNVNMKSVFVLTFYAAQVVSIRRTLDALGLAEVQVSTVDGSQGSEADVVVLSMVRSGGPTVGFLKDFQRLNVSLTRAKHLQLVVGNASTLLDSKVPTLVDLVTDAQARGRLFSTASIELFISIPAQPKPSTVRKA